MLVGDVGNTADEEQCIRSNTGQAKSALKTRQATFQALLTALMKLLLTVRKAWAHYSVVDTDGV